MIESTTFLCIDRISAACVLSAVIELLVLIYTLLRDYVGHTVSAVRIQFD